MKISKKIIALLLSVLCVTGIFTMTLSANAEEKEIADYIGIEYDMGTVGVMYKPNLHFESEYPVITTVTKDLPIAVEHDCIGWKDVETGTVYSPGQEILVDKKITLEAVWVLKDTTLPRFILAMQAGIKVLIRMVEKMLGIYEIARNPVTTAPDVSVSETTTKIRPTDADGNII